VRAASVLAPAVAALFAGLSALGAAGCGSSSSADGLCGALTHAESGFKSTQPTQTIAALDDVIARLSPADRRLVTPVRDYALILYGRTHWSEQHKEQFLTQFFKTDAPALDRRLRNSCRIAIPTRIAPFQNLKGSGS
jgi:hypothetical protein